MIKITLFSKSTVIQNSNNCILFGGFSNFNSTKSTATQKFKILENFSTSILQTFGEILHKNACFTKTNKFIVINEI